MVITEPNFFCRDKEPTLGFLLLGLTERSNCAAGWRVVGVERGRGRAAMRGRAV